MPEEMHLPQLEPAAFTSGLLLQREWYMDRPPFIIRELPDDTSSRSTESGYKVLQRLPTSRAR